MNSSEDERLVERRYLIGDYLTREEIELLTIFVNSFIFIIMPIMFIIMSIKCHDHGWFESC
jgi:hypothetical protein